MKMLMVMVGLFLLGLLSLSLIKEVVKEAIEESKQK
jgi:hypothetical protein